MPLAAGLLAVAAATYAYTTLLHVSNTGTVSTTFLLVVLVVAAASTFRVAVSVSLAAVLAFNYFFLPPVGTFTIADPQNWTALITFLAVSLVIAAVLSDRFTPRRVRDSEPLVRQACTEIIDAVIEQGRCDLVNDVAAHLPMIMIGDMLGVAPADHDMLLRWSDELIAATNGTARLGDVDVIRANAFQVQLGTTPVSLLDPSTSMMVRDFAADGDTAVLRIDEGFDLNNVAGIDNPTPGDVAYGFEDFTDTRIPGFTNSGVGTYAQTIDTTELAEGRHFVTVRAFRHRNSGTGGDGGPAVFTDFKRTVYVDRLPPEAAVVSFDPYASSPGNPNDRDLIVDSTDQTADNMHIFLDLPAGLTNAQVLAMALGGQNDAGEYDRDQWVYGFNSVSTGNHVATVVTFEPTFDGVHGFNVQRFAGLFTDTNIGAGFGDLNNSGTFTPSDIVGLGNNSAEDILYSQNSKFRAAFDVNGDGLGDNRDLFALGDELVVAGAGQAVLDSYAGLLLKRGDLNGSAATNLADFEALYANFGPATWTFDLNVDGVVDAADAETFVTQLVRSVPGDFNVDGAVDAADYTLWRDRLGSGGTGRIADGDFDGDVDDDDYAVWKSAFGFVRGAFPAGSGAAFAATVPEPGSLALVATVLAAALASARRSAKRLVLV